MNEHIGRPANANALQLDLGLAPVVQYENGPAPASLLQGHDSANLRPFSLMRSAVQKKIVDLNVSLIGITSATPNVGKSTIAITLAASLAKVVDRPVILADLDLRRASIGTYLALEGGGGIGQFLSDPSIDFSTVPVRIGDTNLFVMPTDFVPQETAELLAGKRFETFIASLAELPDRPICLFDLPPAFANDDVMIALEALDGYFLVAEAGHTTKRQVLDVLKLLAPAKCFGTILNRYQGTLGDSYSYGSAAYSKYYT